MVIRRFVRWPLLAATLVLCAALLSSCAQGQAHLTIHRDGTADLDLNASISSQTLETIGQPDLPQQLADVLKRNGMDATAEENGSQSGIRATRHLNLRDMEDQPLELPDGMQLDRSTDKHFFYTRYHIAVTMDMSQLMSGSGSDWSAKIASMPTLARKLIESQMNLNFLLTFPIKPGANNADEKQDHGRTLLWHLNLFGTNRFETSFAVPNIRHIAYTAGPALLLVIAAIVFAVIRIRRRRRQSL